MGYTTTKTRLIYSHGAEVNPLYQENLLEKVAEDFRADIVAPVHYGDNDTCKIPEFTYGSIKYRVRELLDAMECDEEQCAQDAVTLMMGYSRGGATIVACMGARETHEAHSHPSKRMRSHKNLTEQDKEGIRKSYDFSMDFTPRVPDAAILFAPGLGHHFEKSSLAKIFVPTLVFAFQDDHIAGDIHGTYGHMANVKIVDLPGNHWTCLDKGGSKLGQLDRGIEKDQRAEVHAQMLEEIWRFVEEARPQESALKGMLLCQKGPSLSF